MIDIGSLVAMLAARAEPLARELLPGGRKEGREWVCGGLDGRAGRGVSVCIAGGKAGIWADFQAGGAGGDMLELVTVTRCGGNKADALRWARAWLGLGGSRPAERAAPVVVPPPRDPAAETARQEARREKGKGLWLAGAPILGSPAERYLGGRGIDLAALGRAPAALRYHPRVWCAERCLEAPAMLAAILAGGRMVGVHRTYLAERPHHEWIKAPVRAAKKVLGQAGGGMIPLWRGASGRPIKDAPDGDVVAIAEGIEDALTIAQHCPEWRVLACIAIGNMGALDLPAAIAEVVLCLDRDGENQSSAGARARAVARYQAEGRRVRQVYPPEGHKDFNAWHQAETAQMLGRAS